MECWPCQNVYSVIDLTDYNNKSLYHSGIPYIFKVKFCNDNIYSVIDLTDYNNKSLYHSGIPYIFKSNQKRATLVDIMNVYSANKEIFDRDASRVKSTNKNIRNIKDLLNYSKNCTKSSSNHISWRINRMTPARIIRTLFPRPQIISEWSGQSVERYIMIDEPNAPHHVLPSFECSYIFVIQGSGQQTIILKPTQECSGTCRTVSVILKPSYVLWYNWWYWRPISLPMANATETSVSYINSYC
ncbi:hypothetical protein AMK59_5885 [Oryctes borbonicus]|uniref:Uncharacterized protein n=1 Tax=Oryctes borbonicus TaxID=1629725 RepID=A0A0T6B2F1_9SCAR|nr:hypothetical protein AMK59_5885 [Oryctes borbonicus]